MNRREFIALPFYGTGSLFFIHNTPFYPEKQKTDIEIKLLTGRIRPVLCGEGYQLIQPAAEAFREMQLAAGRDGLQIWCSSGYRSFFQQAKLWEEKYLDKRISQFSEMEKITHITRFTSIPGTSRHHWGTEVDIVDAWGSPTGDPLDVSHFNEGGTYQYLNYWLTNHAHKFGFFQPYTKDIRRTGFSYEPWHYSFKECAVPFLQKLLDTDIRKIIRSEEIPGSAFMSSAFIEQYKTEYLKGINACLLPG